MDDEKTFKSVRELKYILKPSNNNFLTVVFSAFSAIGQPPCYNYVKTLNDVDCNRLYILDDFGLRGSYYLAENGDYSIEISVIRLIEFIAKEIHIPKENIITCGSSKGGYAALYYAIKYGFGGAIVGSPQVFLGKYLLEQTKCHDVAKFITGDICDVKQHLDHILNQVVLDSDYKPRLYIHVGKGEYHYTTHVLPLMEWLENKQIPYELDLGDYETHDDVLNYFPSYLNAKIKSILGYPSIKVLKPNKLSPQRKNTSITLMVEAEGYELTYAWYIYKNGERIKVEWYSESNILDWKPTATGTYKIMAFVQNGKGYKDIILSEEYLIE